MLITSISGIRGTLGDRVGEDLTQEDVRNFALAYGTWLLQTYDQPSVVMGRDARASGEAFAKTVADALCSLGISVLDLGLATTPTVEMMVVEHQAQGAIIITASHNPKEYNGLKMLNHEGEFLSQEEGAEVLSLSEKRDYPQAEKQGSYTQYDHHHEDHVDAIMNLDLPFDALRQKKFRVLVDTINSVGSRALKPLFAALGVEAEYLHGEANGDFAHMPEPLEKNLYDLIDGMKTGGYDLGIAVDPDVDRLVLVDERGVMFGEEYTLVAAADFVLKRNPGPCVSNLSSSRALRDCAEGYGVAYHASAVGEKNVVEMMKSVGAVIGGEGSGGVIYPPLHYGRDALIGITLILAHLALEECSLSSLRSRYTSYFMAKEKIALSEGIDAAYILNALKDIYANEECSTIDGLKIDFASSWVHIRSSNTEPILRIYTEAKSQDEANALAETCMLQIMDIMGS